MSLAFLGQIQDGKVERIRLNSSQPIRCYNRERPSISGFVASSVGGIERSKLAHLRRKYLRDWLFSLQTRQPPSKQLDDPLLDLFADLPPL